MKKNKFHGIYANQSYKNSINVKNVFFKIGGGGSLINHAQIHNRTIIYVHVYGYWVFGCSLRTTFYLYLKNGVGEGRGIKKTFEFNNYNPFLPAPDPATIRPRTWFKGVVVVQGLLPSLGFLLQ